MNSQCLNQKLLKSCEFIDLSGFQDVFNACTGLDVGEMEMDSLNPVNLSGRERVPGSAPK